MAQFSINHNINGDDILGATENDLRNEGEPIERNPAKLPSWKGFINKHTNAVTISTQVMGEMIGTFFLMFFVCGVSMGDYMSDGNMTIMDHAIAAAFCIMIIIFALGHISGAHVNPAVTVGFASVGKFPWIKVPWYIMGQVVGGILGTFAARVLYDVHVDLVLSLPAHSVARAFIMEFIIGAEFMFLACSVSSNAQVTGLHAAVAVAVSIALNIVAIGPISGASMNPARSLAPAIVAGKYKDLWIYILSPTLGTVFGAWTHKLLTNLLRLAQDAKL